MGAISKWFACSGEMMLARDTGDTAENAACTYLEEQNYTILERNFSCKMGEIDIIAQSPDDEVIFVEVRFRKSADFGGALESITKSKQTKIRRTAEYYLITHKMTGHACRMDVLALSPQKIEWIENAFY